MEEKLAQLTELVTSLAARIDTNGAAPPPMPPPVTTTPPQAPFTPPATTQTGASPSIRSLFPEIEAAHITAIISHDFRGADLWKLDSRYRDKEPAFAFNSTMGQFETSNRAAKDYKSFNSLYIPLVMYFNILSAHIPSTPQRTVPFVFFHFLTHLQKIATEYEWAAVLEYTMVFFNRRWMEMLEFGDYSKWAVPDPGLMAEHVFGNKKVISKAGSSPKNSVTPSRTPPASNSTTTCQNFNSGKCSGAKCPFNRMHICSSCGKSDHSLLEHPKGT
jgi:hypothetical protein